MKIKVDQKIEVNEKVYNILRKTLAGHIFHRHDSEKNKWYVKAANRYGLKLLKKYLPQ